MAACFYSVHNTIVTENTVLGPIELPLTVLLDALENSYTRLPLTYSYELSPTITTELTLPTKLSFTHTDISIEYLTGLTKIRDIEFNSAEEKLQFASGIDPKIAIRLEHTIKKQFSATCHLFNDISVDLIAPDIFYLIFQVFAEKLDDYYELLYYCFEYLKWSWNTFEQFTPLETRILFNQFKIDKERQAEERQKSLNN